MKHLLSFLKGLFAFFTHLPRNLSGFLHLPRQLWLLLAHLWRSGLRWPKLWARCRGEIYLPPEVYKRADPMLYSQEWLMDMGLAVTWDNPDIQLIRHSTPVSSSSLEEGAEYEVRVRIWNNSFDAPAPGLPVHLTMYQVGAGTPGSYIGKRLVDLGAKGTSMCPAYATFKWRTPDSPGHYCLQVRLNWPDDANPRNNMGQENTLVGQMQSPAVFHFRVRNQASVQRRFAYEADDYQLPKPQPCPPKVERIHGKQITRLEESRGRWEWAITTQGYGKFNGWQRDWDVKIEPEKEVLAAGEEIGVRVSIESKALGFKGRKAFNINVFAYVLQEKGNVTGNRRFVGGVTLYVEK